MKIETILLIGAAALGAYLILGKQGVALGAGSTTITPPSLFPSVEGLTTTAGGAGKSSQQDVVPDKVTAATMTGCAETGTALGLPTETFFSKTGSKTVFATPGAYYPDIGIGYDMAGQGYSAAFPLISRSNTTKKTSSVLDLFTKKPFS